MQSDQNNPETQMQTVVKRDGRREEVSSSKIQRRIERLLPLVYPLENVDVALMTKKVIQGVYDGVRTSELDDLASETAASMSATHPDYSKLASRIAVSNLHKRVEKDVSVLYPFLSDDVVEFCKENAKSVNERLDFSRDYQYDIFGFRTLQHSYLMKNEKGEIIECPQMMLMRVAIGIHCGSLPCVLDTYDRLSRLEFTHATPTLFNSGTRSPDLASCFLLPIQSDSIEGIMERTRSVLSSQSQREELGFPFRMSVHPALSSGLREAEHQEYFPC